MGRSGVELLLEGAELDTVLLQYLQQIKEVPQAAAKPAQRGADDGVHPTGAYVLEEPLELGAPHGVLARHPTQFVDRGLFPGLADRVALVRDLLPQALQLCDEAAFGVGGLHVRGDADHESDLPDVLAFAAIRLRRYHCRSSLLTSG